MLAIFAACSFLIKNKTLIMTNYVLLSLNNHGALIYQRLVYLLLLQLLLINCMRLKTDLKLQLNDHYCIGETK